MVIDTCTLSYPCRNQVTLHGDMVGPPGFEPGSDGPQPPSIGQANPRTRVLQRMRNQISLATLNGATSSIKSTWETNMRLQQYRSTPKSVNTSAGSSPALVRSSYLSQRWAITFPQLKHRTGISILITCMTSAISFEHHVPFGVWVPFGADR